MNDLHLRIPNKINLILITLLFMAWRPTVLQSETLTLTTYYPAPYAGYNQLLTTGNTYLAKTSGAFVQWGGYSRLTSDEGGSIQLIASSGTAEPYISFRASSNSHDAKIVLKRVAENNNERLIAIDGDFMVGTSNGLDSSGKGSLRRICTLQYYSNGTVTYCGQSSASDSNRVSKSSKYTIVGLKNILTVDKVALNLTGQTSDAGGYVFIPRSGYMVCCKFESVY